MDELMSNVKTMTIQEVAEALNVSYDVIAKHARNLGFTQNGKKTELLEWQVVEIKNRIGKHDLLLSSKVDAAKTEIEQNNIIANALVILQQRNQTLQHQIDEAEQRAEIATQRAITAERTNQLLMHSTRLYTVTEIAKELGMKSAIDLNQKLEELKIQYKVNGTWVPTSKYSDLGYFEIKQQVHDDTGYVYYDRKVTPEGRKFILELFV